MAGIHCSGLGQAAYSLRGKISCKSAITTLVGGEITYTSFNCEVLPLTVTYNLNTKEFKAYLATFLSN